MNRFFLSIPEAARRTVTAEGGEEAPAEGVNVIGFGIGRGGVGGSRAL